MESLRFDKSKPESTTKYLEELFKLLLRCPRTLERLLGCPRTSNVPTSSGRPLSFELQTLNYGCPGPGPGRGCLANRLIIVRWRMLDGVACGFGVEDGSGGCAEWRMVEAGR